MKTKIVSVFKMSPGNTAGKSNTINHYILGLKTVLGLMAGTYGKYFKWSVKKSTGPNLFK